MPPTRSALSHMAPDPAADARTASRAHSVEALTDIVAVGGPIVARCAYCLLVRASGEQHLSKLVRAPLNRTDAKAVLGMIGDADGVGRVLEVLRATSAGGDAGDGASGPLVFATLLPARPAEHATLDPPLPPPLQRHFFLDCIGLYRDLVAFLTGLGWSGLS